MDHFEPDPRLVEDSYPITELPLCQLRLMNDSRFPWLLLIPRRHGVSEVFELSEAQQRQLWRETSRIGQAFKALMEADKLNVASLGNVVEQLHVHLVLRRTDDGLWPGPVWGQGEALPYDLDTLAAMRDRVLAMLEGLDLQPEESQAS
ncbi:MULTISPECIES: HIT family protein [Halomonas]|uniref:HIT domain-containing protein n=2 Tax=Halomonas TaxID=2745 RepID=A0A7X4W0X5_9GAMM|nr:MULTISPECIES: HIT family protein [Halomonas]MDR5900591.1 HIT family protein [Halomonas icarae]NAW13939.1 HIT domain-containing protein [Halomonas icarae]TDB01295.1 HIT family protein [Halomonas marinisediminis]